VPLPTSFLRDGFVHPSQIRKQRRVLIGTDGPSNSGKTEFALSAPGPGIVICLDRGFDAMLDNPNPPPTRRDDFAFKVIQAPLPTQATQTDYLAYWKAFYAEYVKALNNPDARTVVLDGDSDSWELQRLAEFGKLTQVPSILYANVNAARRAMIARAYDSGKIIIATNKIRKDYQPKLDAKGVVVVGGDGKPLREWDGKAYERQGFDDQDYLWSIQLRHLYRPEEPRWGVKITKCKPDPSVEGAELWGNECNMPFLLQNVYPNVPLKEWGY
jgi:hypothetical protein